MNSKNRTQFGFTIIELLIVVVVISILASVTVVAYSGIQTRSQNTQTITAVSEWTKALISYATIEGDYPYTGDRSQVAPYVDNQATIANNFPCLGEYPGDVCASVNNVVSFGAGHAYVNPAWNALIKAQVGGALAQPSQKDIIINGQPHRGAFLNIVGYATGAAAPGVGPSIAYYLQGKDTKCTSLGGGVMQPTVIGDNGVRCSLLLPDFR